MKDACQHCKQTVEFEKSQDKFSITCPYCSKSAFSQIIPARVKIGYWRMELCELAGVGMCIYGFFQLVTAKNAINEVAASVLFGSGAIVIAISFVIGTIVKSHNSR